MQAVQRKTEYEARPTPLPHKRVVKIEGNVAYISNAFPERKPRTAPAVKPVLKTAVKPAAKPAAKPAVRPKKGLASTLLVIFIAFAAMSALVSRFAAACSVGAQNNELKENIAAVQTRIEALQVDIEIRDDLTWVQQTAQQEMGMVYPDPDQIVLMTPGG
jgi:cell division protein FtsL